MSSGFPPIVLYPFDYDSDFTLFKVYNTSETTIVVDSDAFSEEIIIRPRHADQPEIWADNGYATIAGELFYYDAVEKNGEDRVCRLKRCVRNLAGRQSQFNAIGTWVRGFVIAEHHNQLVNSVLSAEEFVGENFSEDPATLDWRIRHLSDAPLVSDDFGCSSIEFDFNVVSSSSFSGTLASYNLLIQGVASKFTLQFGDGQFTTSARSGTHLYAPGATIDPIVVMQNDSCQIIQSPIVRQEAETPEFQVIVPPFVVPVPIPPPIPEIIIPSIVVPPPSLNIPPIVLPCLTPGGFPSVINVIPPINIPSMINVTPIPSVINIVPPISIPSRILGPDIQIPSRITFDGPSMIPITPPPPIPPIQIQPPNIPPIQTNIPSVISIIGPDIPSEIRITGLHDISLITGGGVSLIYNDFPRHMALLHDLPSVVAMQVPKLEFDAKSIKKVMKSMGESFADALKINLPNFSEMKMQMDWGDMPTLKTILQVQKIKKGQDLNMLETDEIQYEHVDFPDTIKLDTSELREGLQLSIIPFELPKISIETSALEKLSIPLQLPDILPTLKVEFPSELPTLKVEFPREMPTIKVEVPDNLRIPTFYDGPPIPVQVNLKIQNLAEEASDGVQCVKIIPCTK